MTPQQLAGRRLIIFGGGDSALDWAVALAPTAQSLTLVHRREQFRGAPATVARMRELQAAGRIRHIEGVADSLLTDGNTLEGVRIKGTDGTAHEVHGDQVLVFFGLHPKLGPIAEWGLALERKALAVDTEMFQTSVPGIFAVGDINTYPGKKKLILSGFHEAALAAFGDPAPPVSAEEAVPAVHHHQPDHAQAPGRSRYLMQNRQPLEPPKNDLFPLRSYR